MLFEKVGKTQDFYDMLDANIERFSTADKAEIASIAEEMRELGTNKETGVNMFRGKTDEQIVTEALEHNRSLREQADKYREISTNLRSLLGDKFTEDDEMSEMIYLFSQIDNFEGRATELLESLRDNVNTLNIPTLKLKTFPIVLQDEVRELNFVEIVNQATPTELSNWLMDIASTKIEGDFDYSELLFASVPRLLDSQDNLLKTIKDIHKSQGKRGLTQQQHKRIGEIKQKIKSIGESLSQTKERNDIMNILNDLVLIENTRAKLVNTYNSFINAPQLLKDRIAKDKEDAAVKQEEIINKDIKESLKEAATVQDIRNIIAQEAKGKGRNVNNFIQELSVSDNEDFSPVVAEYVRIENTGNDIRNSQPYKSVSDDVQDGVDQLWNIVKNRSNSIEEALNPTVLQDDLGELVPKRGGAYPQEVREEIRDVFVASLNSIKERDAKYSNLKKESSVKSKDAKTPKAEPFKGDSYDGDIIAGSEVSLQDVETSEDNTDSSLQEIKTSNPPPQVENNVLQSLDIQNSIVDTP